jgi:hypothetical protein
MHKIVKRLLWITLYALFWAGLWQLDLICAPLVWQLDEVFLLPFNLPIHVQYAYCLFYAWIILSVHALLVWNKRVVISRLVKH